RIISVDGEPISGQGLQQVADLLRGAAGTCVKVVVERLGLSGSLELTVQREEVKVETVFSTVKEPGVGYIQITSFEQSTGDSFIRHLEALEASDGLGAGLILDLRNNTGGLLDEALKVAGQLVPEGEITRLVDRRGQVKDIHYSYAAGKPYPIAVLINGESASASEVIAGALQDRQAALLVGEKTFGKATVQTLEHLAGGSALRLTVAKYLTPCGRDLHGQGLEPDYYLELPEAFKYYSDFFPAILEEGDYGEEVKLLQQMLWELGYGQLTPSGYFDKSTAEALSDFQADHSLKTSGILDNLTCLRLRQAVEQLFQQADPQLKLARSLLLDPEYAVSGGG
ncbi:MAG TPA: peptidase S41, partial [Firmicutes bacterium]|nr:peptidase S41 [Bacillota bacterium]